MEIIIFNKRNNLRKQMDIRFEYKSWNTFWTNNFLVSSDNISFAIAAGVVSVRNIEFVIFFLNKEVK